MDDLARALAIDARPEGEPGAEGQLAHDQAAAPEVAVVHRDQSITAPAGSGLVPARGGLPTLASMLNLASETDPGWGERVVADLDEVLVDHAHCEKKAAGTAVNLIFRYPQHEFLLEPLSALAREELAHFEHVLRLLAKRGTPFRALKPSPYAGRLRTAVRTHEPARLLDTLLTCALIEARSCERFKRLAEVAPGPELRDFYAGLLAAEARHHQGYLDLAGRLVPEREVRERLLVLADHEAGVLAAVPPLPRIHA